MITPYKYRYTLGPEAIRTKDGNKVVYHKGKRMEIDNYTVEFNNDGKLTRPEFDEIVLGTVGIIKVDGVFKEMEKIIYVTRNSDIYKVNTETFVTTSERDEHVGTITNTVVLGY